MGRQMRHQAVLCMAVGLIIASCGGGESTGTTQLETTTTSAPASATTATTTTIDPGEGPVAADESRIEITYTGDGTSYTGDRDIIEGTVTITFKNESNEPLVQAVFGFETGSEGLAQELEFLEEGESGVPTGVDPVTGWFETEYPEQLSPGSTTWKMDVVPGTYLFDVGPDDFMTTGLWRAAIIEVVPAD